MKNAHKLTKVLTPLFESIQDDKLHTVMRERLESDFEFFVRYFFFKQKGTKFKFSHFHHELCQRLMAIYRGDPGTKETIFNLPPRHSKTEMVVIMFPAWCFVRNPRCEFIQLSYSDTLVLENSERCRAILQSAEFKAFWPHINIMDDKNSKKAWGTNERGLMYATAAGGSVTGFGAGRMDDVDPTTGAFVFSGAIIIDDPLKPDEARHDTMREAINRRWDETIKSRRNSPRTPTIICMQRIHEHDFAGMLLLEDTEHAWQLVKFPALIDEGQSTERSLWPEKHSVESLRAMKLKNAHHFATQYQQSPRPLGGNLLRGEWFQRYEMLPPLRYKVIYGDTAQKTKEHNDYSVFECWGMGQDGRIYLVDLIRGKWEAPELKQRAVDFWNKHKALNVINTSGNLRVMKIEDKASGTGLIQSLTKREGARDPIPVEAIQRNIDKLTRVMDAAPSIQAGYVCVPANAQWVSAFIDECESFTADDTHAHDDQIDPLCDAVNDLILMPKGLNISAAAMQMAMRR